MASRAVMVVSREGKQRHATIRFMVSETLTQLPQVQFVQHCYAYESKFQPFQHSCE